MKIDTAYLLQPLLEARWPLSRCNFAEIWNISVYNRIPVAVADSNLQLGSLVHRGSLKSSYLQMPTFEDPYSELKLRVVRKQK